MAFATKVVILKRSKNIHVPVFFIIIYKNERIFETKLAAFNFMDIQA